MSSISFTSAIRTGSGTETTTSETTTTSLTSASLTSVTSLTTTTDASGTSRIAPRETNTATISATSSIVVTLAFKASTAGLATSLTAFSTGSEGRTASTVIYGRLTIQVEDVGAFLEHPLAEEAVRSVVASLCSVPVESVIVSFETTWRRLSSAGSLQAAFVVVSSLELAHGTAASLEAEGATDAATKLLQAALQEAEASSSHDGIVVGSIVVEAVVGSAEEGSNRLGDLGAETTTEAGSLVGIAAGVAIAAMMMCFFCVVAAFSYAACRRRSLQEAHPKVTKCNVGGDAHRQVMTDNDGGLSLNATAEAAPGAELSVITVQSPLPPDTLSRREQMEESGPPSASKPLALKEGLEASSPMPKVSSQSLVKPPLQEAIKYHPACHDAMEAHREVMTEHDGGLGWKAAAEVAPGAELSAILVQSPPPQDTLWCREHMEGSGPRSASTPLALDEGLETPSPLLKVSSRSLVKPPCLEAGEGSSSKRKAMASPHFRFPEDYENHILYL